MLKLSGGSRVTLFKMEPQHHLDGKLLFALAASAVVGILFWNAWPLYPFKLLVVLMHESSHALATLLVGGSVERIAISPDEGGVTCSTVLTVTTGAAAAFHSAGLSPTRDRAP